MTPANVWTKPQQVYAGEISTKEFWNTYLRDNFTHLKERPFASGSVSAVTTTSASFVEMTGSSVSITTTGGYLLWWASGWVQNSLGGSVVFLDLAVDGIKQGHAINGTTLLQAFTANYADNINLMMITGGGAGGSALAAGGHSCSIYWKTTAGTSTSTLNLFVMEIC